MAGRIGNGSSGVLQLQTSAVGNGKDSGYMIDGGAGRAGMGFANVGSVAAGGWRRA